MESVPVDFVSLRGALEDHTVRWHLDLRSGELIPQFDDPDLNGEFHEDIEPQPELFLHVEPLPSREGFAMDKQVSAA